ncbi:sodium/hydrogen exchanger [Litchfieldella anticariensis FP35 = DSM 16096]|uniref:Sodium/hydrogen exchanger n=1 Tax=Litchfieldella anticariensis (strain DSM 16096 / CECT 5854 / CIP 108499 / LMG 22089 / FP35) TaxID=1121939 RepID=S2KM17_LITA3|nr:sodium:proton antiporter [Halomonas anticariensis]EPC03192.1 sodium/hydrogen exchanger [Halomonas anticariensis FP35 = DSM 16096]
MEHAGFDLAMIGLMALICQWLAWQLKLPAILMLLVAGIAAGPVAGLLDPDALFGELLFPLVSLAVAVILFEGSLTLSFRELGGHGRTVRRLVTWGALITGVTATLAAHALLGLSWEMASVLGALLVVTGPTVILPMLQTLRAREHLTQILRWEGILIDPVGAIGAVLVYEFVALGSGSDAATQTLLLFGETALIGFGLGIAGGYLWGQVLRRYWLPRQLHSFGTLMMMLALFSLSNLLFHESGLLTVTVMGAWLANMRGVPTRPIIEFKETLSVLLISGLFILLAARLTVEQLALLGWPAWAFLVVLVGVARPLAVWLCTLGSRLELREKALLAFISPRGIVAAATQSLLSRPLARWLGVQRPSPDGVLIIGANQVARAVGSQLQAAGVSVVLTDSSWDAIQLAQRAGLTTYYGDPLSEHAAQHLELSGIGYLLPLSPYRELNALAALHFEHLLGRDRVFRLAIDEGSRANRPHAQALDHLPLLFGREVTFARLSRLVEEGGEVCREHCGEKFRMEPLRQAHNGHWLPMLCIGPSGRLRLATAEGGLTPRRGDTLVSLIFADSPARQAPPAS